MNKYNIKLKGVEMPIMVRGEYSEIYRCPWHPGMCQLNIFQTYGMYKIDRITFICDWNDVESMMFEREKEWDCEYKK